MFSKRIDRIQPSATLEMTAKAAELRLKGVDVLNLSVGEPDFNTPKNIIDAAKNAIDSGYTKYTPGSGILPLKKAVCNKLFRDNQLEYNPDQIIISCGGKHALYNACQVLFEKGDEVIIFFLIGYLFLILYQLQELNLFLSILNLTNKMSRTLMT